MFKVIIAGSRTFNDYDLLRQYADMKLSFVSQREKIEIVSGCASGVDALGERYAAERGYPVKRFPADWQQYGKSAGYRRNQAMAQYEDALIAFWDGQSRGTMHMIALAKEHGLMIGIKGIK